jgi:hypothetical protein
VIPPHLSIYIYISYICPLLYAPFAIFTYIKKIKKVGSSLETKQKWVVLYQNKKKVGIVFNVSILCIDVPKIPFCLWMCSTLTPHLPKHLVVLIVCI